MREKSMVDNGIAYAALALALVTNANSVAAQTAAPATSPPGEVVVTANKRAEPLRKVPESISVVSGARAIGCPIIWTRQGVRADGADLSPYGKWRARRAGLSLDDLSQGSLTHGTPGNEILSELAVHAQDIFVDKTANGAFCQTDLEMILPAQSIAHLIFCGVTTDVCVHRAPREAVDRKYQCVLAEDACASADSYAHEAAIHMVTAEDGISGVIASTDAVLEGFRKLSAPDAMTAAELSA